MRSLFWQKNCKLCYCVQKPNPATCITNQNYKSITLPSSMWDQSKGSATFETNQRATWAARYLHTFNNCHFEGVIKSKTQDLWSWLLDCPLDSGHYLNTNACLASAFPELAEKHGVLIMQKFLVAWHTQMDCDSIHSNIECEIFADVFTPREYLSILQTARISPLPYHVKVLKREKLLKRNGSYFIMIKPGKKKLRIWLCMSCSLFNLAVKARSISSCPSQSVGSTAR